MDIRIINGCIEFEGFTVAKLAGNTIPATIAWKFSEALGSCYSEDEIEKIKEKCTEEGYERGRDAGYDDGYSAGEDAGYKLGEKDGETAGYAKRESEINYN